MLDTAANLMNISNINFVAWKYHEMSGFLLIWTVHVLVAIQIITHSLPCPRAHQYVITVCKFSYCFNDGVNHTNKVKPCM